MQRGAVVMVAVAFLAGTGCSRSGPALARVTGRVSLDDAALPGGTICFIPDGSKGTSGRMATAAIGPDGRFTMESFKTADGAIVGFHRVSVESWETPPVPPQTDPNALPPPPPLRRSRIPVRYNDHATSGLTAEVKPGVANEFEFRLTKAK